MHGLAWTLTAVLPAGHWNHSLLHHVAVVVGGLSLHAGVLVFFGARSRKAHGVRNIFSVGGLALQIQMR